MESQLEEILVDPRRILWEKAWLDLEGGYFITFGPCQDSDQGEGRTVIDFRHCASTFSY